MNELPVEWVLGAAGALTLGLLACAATMLSMLGTLRQLRADRDRNHRQQAMLKKALLELGRHQQKTGRHLQRLQNGHQRQLRALDQRLERTSRQQQDLELRDPGNVTYAHASRLVEMGAASEDLVDRCGLSQAEARLISMMHRPERDRVQGAA
ncbi:MAG: DUF2802 domain-containing protein [Pseudomonadota bacterium]